MNGTVTRYPVSHFLDLVVDGSSLLDRLPRSGGMVTGLNRTWLPDVSDAIEELRGRRPAPGLAADRVRLLVCGYCGDLGCGAVTAAIGVDADVVEWFDFAWENDYAEPQPVPDAPDRIVFARPNYDEQFDAAYQRIAAMPYDELAEHGTRSRWPWQWGWRLPPRTP